MKNLKVSLGFTRLSDGELSALTKSVIANMTTMPLSSMPRFPQVLMRVIRLNFATPRTPLIRISKP